MFISEYINRFRNGCWFLKFPSIDNYFSYSIRKDHCIVGHWQLYSVDFFFPRTKSCQPSAFNILWYSLEVDLYLRMVEWTIRKNSKHWRIINYYNIINYSDTSAITAKENSHLTFMVLSLKSKISSGNSIKTIKEFFLVGHFPLGHNRKQKGRSCC